MRKPLIIGHRGASAEAPENTLIAVQKAIELKVDFVEVDIRLSKDGVPFLFHDLTLFRTTGDPPSEAKHLSELDSATIKTLDAGLWFGKEFAGHPVPTLEELLQLNRGNVGLMIEIKEEMADPRTIAQAVYNAIKKYPRSNGHGPIIIGSFSPTIIFEFQRLNTHIPLIGIMETKKEIERFKWLDIRHVALHYDHVTASLVDALHQEEMSIWTYTVDEVPDALELRKAGVDGIITNDPRKISSCFNSLITENK